MSEHYRALREAGRDLELFLTAGAALPAGYASSAAKNGRKRVREEMIKLIQQTFLSGAPGAPRRLVFTGVERGSGCSWVCARAAETLAALVDGSVCVIEANPQAASLQSHFDIRTNREHAEFTVQQPTVPDFARSILGTNLWLVSGSELPADAADHTHFERLKSCFDEVRSAFNYVLVDTPPVNESAESLILGRMADGVILVLEAHVTRREAARKAKQCLEAANVKLLGVALNKRTYPIPEAIYRRI